MTGDDVVKVTGLNAFMRETHGELNSKAFPMKHAHFVPLKWNSSQNVVLSNELIIFTRGLWNYFQISHLEHSPTAC